MASRHSARISSAMARGEAVTVLLEGTTVMRGTLYED